MTDVKRLRELEARATNGWLVPPTNPGKNPGMVLFGSDTEPAVAARNALPDLLDEADAEAERMVTARKRRNRHAK